MLTGGRAVDCGEKWAAQVPGRSPELPVYAPAVSAQLPHVVVKFCPGKSEKQKAELAEGIANNGP
jgi:hypothetical protein